MGLIPTKNMEFVDELLNSEKINIVDIHQGTGNLSLIKKSLSLSPKKNIKYESHPDWGVWGGHGPHQEGRS